VGKARSHVLHARVSLWSAGNTVAQERLIAPFSLVSSVSSAANVATGFALFLGEPQSIVAFLVLANHGERVEDMLSVLRSKEVLVGFDCTFSGVTAPALHLSSDGENPGVFVAGCDAWVYALTAQWLPGGLLALSWTGKSASSSQGT
jgi:hypothetical protein